MAYVHTEQNRLYLLVLSRSPGLYAVTVLNTQTTLVWMVWKVLLTSQINTACSAYIGVHKYPKYLSLTVFLVEAIDEVCSDTAVS